MKIHKAFLPIGNGIGGVAKVAKFPFISHFIWKKEEKPTAAIDWLSVIANHCQRLFDALTTNYASANNMKLMSNDLLSTPLNNACEEFVKNFCLSKCPVHLLPHYSFKMIYEKFEENGKFIQTTLISRPVELASNGKNQKFYLTQSTIANCAYNLGVEVNQKCNKNPQTTILSHYPMKIWWSLANDLPKQHTFTCIVEQEAQKRCILVNVDDCLSIASLFKAKNNAANQEEQFWKIISNALKEKQPKR